MLDVAGQLKRLRAARPAAAILGIKLCALMQNDRHARERNDVVDHRRLTEQTFMGWQWRLEANLPALAFEAFEQRGFFTADIGTGATPHFQMEGTTAAENIVTEIAGREAEVDGATHDAFGIGILTANIDKALGRTDREAGDGHALDQHARIAFHQHAIGESAGVAFVGVAHDVFLRGLRVRHGLPLDASRKGCAAASAQTAVGHRFHDHEGLELKRATQTGVAVMQEIVSERQRIDDADPTKGQTFLITQIGDVFGGTKRQRMRGACKKPRVEQARDIALTHRAVSLAPAVDHHFDQRLQPIQSTRTIAHHADRQVARRGLRRDRTRHRLRADRERAGVGGDKNRDGAHGRISISCSSSSRRAPSRRPCRMPSMVADGAQAQAPKQ